jgi:LPS sulfotransferase NodH
MSQSPHVNFIVLGHQRCGSNLVFRALVEHPEVRMLGEVLARNRAIAPGASGSANPLAWANPPIEGYKLGEDGAAFLEQRIFAADAVPNRHAFGFKLFYDHARWDSSSRTAWDFLASHDIRVIHLIRRNLLYALISREVAERTDRWNHRPTDKTPPPPPPAPFALDPMACKQYFDEITACREAAYKTFAHHKLLSIEYERDLCDNFKATTRRVFEFLDVTPVDSEPRLIKQQKLTAAQQIANFNDLSLYFRGTPYAEFFLNADSPEGIRAVAV